MENNEFKKVRIKNRKLENFDLDNTLIDEKSHENILIYDISCKTLIDSKPLRIRFDKIDGLIRISNGSKYLVLLGPKKYDAIYDRIRYLINLKSGITYIFSHCFAKIKVDSDDYLPIEKRLTLHNVIISLNQFYKRQKSLLLEYTFRKTFVSSS